MQEKPHQKLTIKLHVLTIVLEIRTTARSISELEITLKKEYALQEFKSFGVIKRANRIGGFYGYRNNPALDFLLAQKD